MLKLSLKCVVILSLMLFAVQADAAPITISNISFKSLYLSAKDCSFSNHRWSVFDTDADIAYYTINPSWYPLNQFDIVGLKYLIATTSVYFLYRHQYYSGWTRLISCPITQIPRLSIRFYLL